MFMAVNNNKYKKICTLDTIHAKKQHNKESRYIMEMLSMVIGICCCKNAHSCHELLETKVYVSYVVCCHNNNSRPQGSSRLPVT